MASTKFPWLMVLRWLLGLAILASGIYGIYNLATSWRFLTDRAIIDPLYSPYLHLPLVALKIATGVAILMRSKWSIPIAMAWTVSFTYVLAGADRWRYLSSASYFALMELLAVLGFLLLLWSRGRLR